MTAASACAILTAGRSTRVYPPDCGASTDARCDVRSGMCPLGEQTLTRVLIVDDLAAFRRRLRRLLAEGGLAVVGEAGDIPSAEAQVELLQPDLAIVDVMLPGVNGIDGTSRLKALMPGMRVILISAYSDQGDVFREAAEEVGAEAFVCKDDLDLRTVRRWKHM